MGVAGSQYWAPGIIHAYINYCLQGERLFCYVQARFVIIIHVAL